jgi:hypothetical protein
MKAHRNSEFNRFTSALRAVLSVSHEEMKRRLEEEKRAQAGKSKRGPSRQRFTKHQGLSTAELSTFRGTDRANNLPAYPFLESLT